MPSYQDIETRLGKVERLLDFIASNARMRATITSGVLDGAGNPIGKVFEGSLKELYYLSNQLPLVTDSDESELKKETENV